MKIVKLAIISAVVLFGLVWLISLLMPSQVRVSRAVDIMAPAKNVAADLANVKQWEQWNTFLDSFSHKQFPSASQMTSDQLNISITSATDSLIMAEWKQKNTETFISGYNIIASGSVTTVQWYLDFHVKWYPWEKFASMVYETQMGPPMERSLLALKKNMEGH